MGIATSWIARPGLASRDGSTHSAGRAPNVRAHCSIGRRPGCSPTKVLLPGATTLEHFVAKLRHRVDVRVWRVLASGISPPQQRRLEDLLRVPDEGRSSSLVTLRTGAAMVSGPALVRALERLNAVRSLSITVPAAAAIAPTRIAALARFAEKAKVTAVARLPALRRAATLVAFVPPAPIQELRDLTRTRKQLVREIARHTLRLQKTLEDANVKLTRVASDILGVSGRAILAALIAGQTDPERLADCTKGRLKADRADIVAAVHGRVTAHHRFLLKLHLAQIDALTAAVQQVEQQADEVLRPFREAADRLATMPGVSETVARVIIAEVGVDMTQFPSAGHLVSWAGLCPRLDESAGKRRSTRIRHATPWLKTALVQAAWAATRKNGSYLQAQFRRLKGRRGPKKAIVAVAASMLTAAYFMLRDEKDYHDLGGRYLANRDKQRVTQSLLRRLRNLGVEVEVKAA